MATETQDIWFITEVYRLVNQALWPAYVPPVTGANYGWFNGGQTNLPANTTNNIERLDFTNDTTNSIIRSQMTISRRGLAATRNTDFCWNGGGFNSTNTRINNIDRFQFSNDTVNSLDRSDLTQTNSNMTSSQSELHGYWAGGVTGAGTPTSRIERITFATDTVNSTARSQLLSTTDSLSASQNLNFAWWAGGVIQVSPNIILNRIERTSFATDTVNSIDRADLLQARFGLTGATDSNFAWWTGGFSPSIPGISNRIERYDFANDLNNVLNRSSLIQFRTRFTGVYNNNFGWWAGGETFPRINSIERTDFANDTTNALDRSDLSESPKAQMSGSQATI